MVFCVFFFFKQKTAYEMRISDWSSDVCSSDLSPRLAARGDGPGRNPGFPHDKRSSNTIYVLQPLGGRRGADPCFREKGSRIGTDAGQVERSEEHTSELQSLMRISYAVFCLKKKKHNKTTPSTENSKYTNIAHNHKNTINDIE